MSSSELRTDWLHRRATYLRAQAAESFSPTPVAGRFERDFVVAYREACARAAEVLDVADFAASEADRRRFMTARWTAAVAVAVGATAGFTVAGWVLAAVLGAVGFVLGAYGGGALGAYRAEAYGDRVLRMAADRRAYREWSTDAATAESVCTCSYRSSIHDADCPGLFTRPPVDVHDGDAAPVS